jgi:hypothetical protein
VVYLLITLFVDVRTLQSDSRIGTLSTNRDEACASTEIESVATLNLHTFK